MAEWYLATYQNSVFSNDLGIIQPSGDYVYKLKNGIKSTESPEKEDWLRITITNTDNTVEEWNSGSWTQDTTLTGLVNNSTYWVYGKPYSYKIVTNNQTYYLETFSNNENGDTRTIAGKDINDSDVTINDLTTITAVTIGSSVTSIGNGAFMGCSSLVSVNIPDSVETIGGAAFYECYSLASVNIPDSVTSIGDYAFQGCSSLASLTIGNSVETIGEYAFFECSSLVSLTIPDSVTEIGIEAFQQCYRLASVTIPDSVTSIDNDAFFRISENYSFDANITISQSTVRRLKISDKYDRGAQYYPETFFGATVTLIVI